MLVLSHLRRAVLLHRDGAEMNTMLTSTQAPACN